MRRLFVPVVVGLLAIALGCSPGQDSTQIAAVKSSDTAKKSAGAEQKPAAPAGKESTKPKEAEKKPADTKPAEKRPGQEIVANGSFEHWANGAPAGWNPAQGHGNSWKAATMKKASPGHAGETALGLPPPSGKNGQMILAQTIDPKKIKLGQPLTLSAAFMAKHPEEVYVVLSFRQQGTEVKKRVISKGAGSWENVSTGFTVPADADPASFRLQVIRKALSKEPVLVDSISAQF